MTIADEIREKWGPGPWQLEPTLVEFETKAGYKAKIIRNESMGNLLGYIGVPIGHAAYKLHYDDLDVNVHGGLTYSNKTLRDFQEPRLWWFGFDCAHSTDLVPAMAHMQEYLDTYVPKERDVTPGVPAQLKSLMSGSYTGLFDTTYKNIEFVRNELESLSEQLASM